MKYPEEMYLDCGFYDGDMDAIIENHKEKIVKCRKDHKCSACQNIIKKGDKALYESGFMDGAPGSGGEAEGEETGHLYRYKKYG